MLFTFVFVMGFVVELACSATNQQETADPWMMNIPMLIALHCATVGIRQMTWHEKLSMQSTCPLNPFQQSYCCIAIMQWAAMPNMTITCMYMKQKASDTVGHCQQAAHCQRMHAKWGCMQTTWKKPTLNLFKPVMTGPEMKLAPFLIQPGRFQHSLIRRMSSLVSFKLLERNNLCPPGRHSFSYLWFT